MRQSWLASNRFLHAFYWLICIVGKIESNVWELLFCYCVWSSVISVFTCTLAVQLSSAVMGDHVEIQITPETPGRPSIRNPFESPNDYHHLREPLVPSPSVFKSKPCRTTPPKFNWSIEEMASLLPVHIDQEEIQRQSLYLSQTKMDSEIERKRQNAIEHFFTKGAIVPSPWAAPETHKLDTVSPLAENPGRISVGCQTTLSLPLAFDLEKILGEYYRFEPCDTVQETLSSSSLRRKLFLDGKGSGSDSSTPPSPERYRRGLNESEDATEGNVIPEVEGVSSIFSSPLSCGISAPTPSTGQFSSSPIQNGCFRDCSLGSINSPVLADRSSPAQLSSPTISPIFAHAACTPKASNGDVTSCAQIPFVEGCSPIRSCSPHQPHCHNELKNYSRTKLRTRVGSWTSPPLISPILNPKLQDSQELEDQMPSSCPSSMELDPSSPQVQAACPRNNGVNTDNILPMKMEAVKEKKIEGRLEDDDEPEGPTARLTSSRMGNVSAGESSQMFVSLLAEGSSIRYDSSMQVDSGYNTTSAGTGSLIDGISSDFNSKECLTSTLAEDAFQLTRHTKVKVFYSHHHH